MTWQNELLKSIYYNTKLGFKSVNRLYKEAHKLDPRIRIIDVKNFLKKQESYQINTIDNKQLLFKINALPGYYQMDLTFYPQYKKVNEGYSIMLCLIEIASRKAYIIPIKNKTENEIYDAINKLITRIKGIKAITSDNGSEFTNKKVEKLLKDNNIIHYLGQAEDKRTLSIVERFNRTIKTYLTKYFTAYNTYKWIDVIDDILDNYNNSYHSSLKTSPNEISNKEIRINYVDNIIHNAEIRNKMNLKVGDYVRTMNTKNTFDKEGEKYSKTVYIIDSIIGNKYSIKNSKTDNILQKKYGINELLKIDNDTPEGRDLFETNNQEEKEKVVKEHKTDKIITKEGLSKDNVIEGRPKRSAFNTEKMKEVYKILRRR